jgi:hypothetical protein
MNDCGVVRDLFVLYAGGGMTREQARFVEDHLERCPECRIESAEIGKVNGWLRDEQLFVPVEDADWRALPLVCTDRARAAARGRSRNRVRLRWVLPIAAALLMAISLVWVARRPEAHRPNVQTVAAAPGNQDFLGKIESAMTREATARYLTECQDLLVDVLNAGQTCSGKRYDVAFQAARARDLLEQKRMLDPELNAPEVARAKELCDALEDFLVSLSMSQNCETEEMVRWLELAIQKQKLLLRINLVRSEMS